LLRQQS